MSHAVFETMYDLQDTVRIKAINSPAFIIAIRIDVRATCYYAAYWFDGRRYEEWLFERELEPFV